MVLFNLIFTPHFWSLQTFNVNMTQVVTIVIVGIGMTLVVATGGIDLSVGASMAISGALAPMLFLNIAGPAASRSRSCCRCWPPPRAASSTACW